MLRTVIAIPAANTLMESNPYNAPASNLFGGTTATSGATITDGVVFQLKGTKPWVRFLSVMGFIGAGLMLAFAVALAVFGELAGMMAGGQGAASMPGFGIGMGVFYAFLSIFYIYPSMKLWGYANGIGRLLLDRSAMNLEAALLQQRRLWKFVGIIMVIYLGLAALAILLVVVAVAVGAFAGASGAAGGAGQGAL